MADEKGIAFPNDQQEKQEPWQVVEEASGRLFRRPLEKAGKQHAEAQHQGGKEQEPRAGAELVGGV